MDTDLDQLQRQLQLSGFCILPDVVPVNECARIRDDVAHTVERQRRNYPGAPERVGFTPGIINHTQSFAEYLADDTILALLDRLLGPHVRISFTSAIINEPGNERGAWHADWPFNQKNAGRIPAPYPDAIMHVTTLWMLSPFHADNGGTLVLPGSHRSPTNPTVGDDADPLQPLPAEINATGAPGSVLIMDSRLWHATAPNNSESPRVALAVRYAPWWLNLEVLRPESDERKRMCDEAGQTDNQVPSLPRDVYLRLPPHVQQLYRHWVVESVPEMAAQ